VIAILYDRDDPAAVPQPSRRRPGSPTLLGGSAILFARPRSTTCPSESSLFASSSPPSTARRDPDPDRIADLQRERAVARIEDFAAGIFTAAPPLRAEQRQHLAEIMLRGASAAA
jgi:hypothetical protein